VSWKLVANTVKKRVRECERMNTPNAGLSWTPLGAALTIHLLLLLCRPYNLIECKKLPWEDNLYVVAVCLQASAALYTSVQTGNRLLEVFYFHNLTTFRMILGFLSTDSLSSSVMTSFLSIVAFLGMLTGHPVRTVTSPFCFYHERWAEWASTHFL
jgi:hypothetical protein